MPSSSAKAAARVFKPTGPPENFSHKVWRRARSLSSKPRESTPRAFRADWVIWSEMVVWPATAAKSRMRLKSRLAILGVFLDLWERRVLAFGSIFISRMEADLSMIWAISGSE